VTKVLITGRLDFTVQLDIDDEYPTQAQVTDVWAERADFHDVLDEDGNELGYGPEDTALRNQADRFTDDLQRDIEARYTGPRTIHLED